MNPRYYRSEQYNCQMNELIFQAGVKGMSERSELIPCNYYLYTYKFYIHQEHIIEKKGRGRERETTTHLIKFPVFTHASRVTKFRYDYDARVRMYVTPPMQRELSKCEKDRY